jgi:hypothetical protein
LLSFVINFSPAYDSLEAIAAKVVEFAKTHYMMGEHVRIDINSDVYMI